MTAPPGMEWTECEMCGHRQLRVVAPKRDMRREEIEDILATLVRTGQVKPVPIPGGGFRFFPAEK